LVELSGVGSAIQSVPIKFLEKYGAYFSQKVNIFQGPSGRMVEVCFSGAHMPRFTTGWKAFHKENGVGLGDVLLFSLRAPRAGWYMWFEATPESEKK
jgi:hypothetical protein